MNLNNKYGIIDNPKQSLTSDLTSDLIMTIIKQHLLDKTLSDKG